VYVKVDLTNSFAVWFCCIFLGIQRFLLAVTTAVLHAMGSKDRHFFLATLELTLAFGQVVGRVLRAVHRLIIPI
jgi:hypothetical protein